MRILYAIDSIKGDDFLVPEGIGTRQFVSDILDTIPTEISNILMNTNSIIHINHPYEGNIVFEVSRLAKEPLFFNLDHNKVWNCSIPVTVKVLDEG